MTWRIVFVDLKVCPGLVRPHPINAAISNAEFINTAQTSFGLDDENATLGARSVAEDARKVVNHKHPIDLRFDILHVL